MSGINVIQDESLRATESGFEIQVRYKWYRSLQLSCVEGMQLALDGHAVDQDHIKFCINDGEYRLGELAEKVEEFWFILDWALLKVDLPGKVNRGETHQIDVMFGMRTPYIPIGPEKFLTVVNKQSVTQIAA